MVFIFVDDGSERVGSGVQANQTHTDHKLTFGDELFDSEVGFDQRSNHHSAAVQQFIYHTLFEVQISLACQQYLRH